MRFAEEMTPDELRELADEMENCDNTPILEGFLKHDLYTENLSYNRLYLIDVLTQEQVNEEVEFFRKAFYVVLKKGTRFVCKIRFNDEYWDEAEKSNELSWGIEGVGASWAKKHLENIREI